MFTTLLLLALPSAALADAPPQWPEGAHIAVGTNQKLYDEPAKTEEELMRREGLYGLSLHWPEATDDGEVVQYRVMKSGVLQAAVRSGGRLVYEADAKGTITWSVVAVDDTGQASAPLEATSAHLDSHGMESSGRVMMLLGSTGGTSPEAERLLDDLDHGRIDSALLQVDGIAVASGAGVGGLVSSSEPGSSPPPARPAVDGKVELLSSEGPVVQAEISRVLRRAVNQFKYCAERELVKDAAESGRVELTARVHPSGVVEMSKVRSETMGSTAAAECMSQRLRRMRFPEADEPTDIVVRVTIEEG